MKTEIISKVVSEDITSIDNRITGCLIENPTDINDEYYAKIWFAYKIKGSDKKPDGRQEFESKTKEGLLSDIKSFMVEEKTGWEIL